MAPCSLPGKRAVSCSHWLAFLLVLTSGFTASAIAANVYRIGGFEPETTYRTLLPGLRSDVRRSERDVRDRDHGPHQPGMVRSRVLAAIAAVCYWSLVLGIVVFYGSKNFARIASPAALIR